MLEDEDEGCQTQRHAKYDPPLLLKNEKPRSLLPLMNHHNPSHLTSDHFWCSCGGSERQPKVFSSKLIGAAAPPYLVFSRVWIGMVSWFAWLHTLVPLLSEEQDDWGEKLPVALNWGQLPTG